MSFLGRKQEKKAVKPVEKLVSAFDLPKTVLPGMANIELTGNREAIVDGCDGIVQYDDEVIKLSTGKLVVCFYGNRLTIRTLTTDQAVIEGEIISIQFLT